MEGEVFLWDLLNQEGLLMEKKEGLGKGMQVVTLTQVVRRQTDR